MKRRLSLLLLGTVLLTCAANRLSRPRTSGPLLGFIYDPASAAIRPISGLPGAAVVNDPIDIGFPVASAAVAPLHDCALAISSQDGLVRLIQFGARVSTTIVSGAMPSPDRIVFSSSGTAALLYSTGAAHAQVLTGIPQSPTVYDLPFSVASGTMALADDGAAVLLPDAGGAQVWFGDGNAPVSLSVSAAAAAFRAGSHDALAATANGDLYLFEAAANQWRLARSGDGATRNAAAVQFSADGVGGYVAAASGISVVDLATGESATMACNCVPTSLDPLMAGSIYHVTAAPSLLWLFDASQASPHFWFVPPRKSQ